MAAERNGPDREQLQAILQQAFLASPRNYQRTRSDPSPLEDMLGSSQAVDLLRQYLPARAGDTRLGQQAAALIPAGPGPESFREKLRRAVQATPLGGYSSEYLQGFDAARTASDELRRQTVRVGRVPTVDLAAELPTPGLRAAATQAAGVTLADAASDGARNIWWFLNAPQAVGSLAALYALHRGGQVANADRPAGDKGPLLKNRSLRLAATLPTVIGISLGIGNVTRLPGYKAAAPSASDPRQGVDPVTEALSRYFLGRSGHLLPYEQFAEERPDVSEFEYKRYKRYLFSGSSPLKATADGIHGPEVTFMGKSIPLTTGLLPAVAAAVGAGVGMRRGAQRLRAAAADAPIGFRALEQARETVAARNLEARGAKGGDGQRAAQAALADAKRQRDAITTANDLELFKQSAGVSTAALVGAGVVGELLESLRRSTRAAAPEEPRQVWSAP